jgi:isocitrate lyase
MGVSNILIARTDSESGKLLSSNIDPRDHEFILGVADVTAKSIKSQSELLYELEINGASAAKINAAELEWTQKHPLVTFTKGTSIHLTTNTSRQTKSWSLCSIQCLFHFHPWKVPHTSP